MQQQVTRRIRRGTRNANANTKLSQSTSKYVRTVLTGLSDPYGTFATEYLHTEFLSKLREDDVVSPTSRRNAAIIKWADSERKNAATNNRLRGLSRDYNIMPRVPFYRFLEFAQRLTRHILGPLRDEVVLGSFSGGASTSRRRTESHPAQKFHGKVDVTADAEDFVGLIHHLSPLMRQYGIFDDRRVVEGAVLFTVPKKSDIDRCACKEPDINMYLQKGVGAHIRRRLLRFGINLNDQSINRRLARQGSIDGTLATLDLSSASDSITIKCVQSLLPTDWFEYLNYIRSPIVLVDGYAHRTEMFSSMGNGFTFELESLLFYVLMRTVSYFEGVSGVISVYGDDIIIPTVLFGPAEWVLREFGFALNPDKSFHEGPFRESCGGHYHCGEDVTPFYLKQDATHITDVIRLANQLRRWTCADPARKFMLPTTYDVWSKLAVLIPKDLWGGYDCEVDTQLASPHTPKNKLVRLNRKKEVPPGGDYVNWHNSNWKRAAGPNKEGFAPLATESKRCRRRRARNGAPPLLELFCQEET